MQEYFYATVIANETTSYDQLHGNFSENRMQEMLQLPWKESRNSNGLYGYYVSKGLVKQVNKAFSTDSLQLSQLIFGC